MGKDSQNIVSSKAKQGTNDRLRFVNFSKRILGPINVSDNKFNSQGRFSRDDHCWRHACHQ